MKTENPNVCVTVNCKVCISAIALYHLKSRVVCLSDLIIQSTLPTRENMNFPSLHPVYKGKVIPVQAVEVIIVARG
jgi:hypothetical protein